MRGYRWQLYKEGHLRNIATQTDAHFIITAGPGEEKTAQALSSLVGDISHNIYISNRGGRSI